VGGAGSPGNDFRARAGRTLNDDPRRRLARPIGRRRNSSLVRRSAAADGHGRARENGPAGDARPCFRIEEPPESEAIAVGIGRGGRVHGDARADRRVDFDRRLAGTTVHDDGRIVVRFVPALDRPVHARGEIVLERLPPPPDGGLVGGIRRSTGAGDRVARVVAARVGVAALRPERTRLPVEAAPDVAAAPPAKRGAHRAGEAVVDQAEE
jgi:hypothetical protein